MVVIRKRKSINQLPDTSAIQLMLLGDAERQWIAILRRIGSVMFNTVTNKVEYFIPPDDIVWRTELDRAKEVSRFMSVDPLAKTYPSAVLTLFGV